MKSQKKIVLVHNVEVVYEIRIYELLDLSLYMYGANVPIGIIVEVIPHVIESFEFIICSAE